MKDGMRKCCGVSLFVGVFVSLCALVIMLGCAGTPAKTPTAGESAAPPGPSMVYWTLSNNGPDPTEIVVRANGDGSHRQAIVSRPRSFLGWFLAVDPGAGQVLWTTVGSIARTNLDGTAEVKTQGNYPAPMGIAVDSKNSLVYWVDSSLRTISVSKLDGAGARTLLSNLAEPRGLALDSVNNMLYWTAPRDFKVFRSSIDDPKPKEFAALRNWVSGIAVDSLNGNVYWAQGGSIFKAKVDGSELMPLIEGLGAPVAVAVDPVEGKLYWTDGQLKKVLRANSDGSGVETIADTSPYYPWGIAVLPGR